jgi:hypothetical protein
MALFLDESFFHTFFRKRYYQKSCLQKQVLRTRFSNGGWRSWVQKEQGGESVFVM